jgi:hypothetical protein
MEFPYSANLVPQNLIYIKYYINFVIFFGISDLPNLIDDK